MVPGQTPAATNRGRPGAGTVPLAVPRPVQQGIDKMADWFRSWHGAPMDPKWLTIGRRAGVVPGIVSAVAWALFDHASQGDDRGDVSTFDVETYAAFSGFDEQAIAAVVKAMVDKGVIVEGRLANWERRQPVREDNSTDRVRAFRERKRITHTVSEQKETSAPAVEHNETQRNAMHRPRAESDTDTESDPAAAQQSRGRTSALDALDAALRGAAGLGPSEGAGGLYDLSPIRRLLDAGIDLELDVLPVIRRKMASRSGRAVQTWAYFEAAILEAHAERTRPVVIPTDAGTGPPRARTRADEDMGRQRALLAEIDARAKTTAGDVA